MIFFTRFAVEFTGETLWNPSWDSSQQQDSKHGKRECDFGRVTPPYQLGHLRDL